MFKTITQRLLNALSRNLPRRLVRRDPLLGDALQQNVHGGKAQEIPASMANHSLKCARATEDQLYLQFGSHPEGLTGPEVEAIRERVGFNQTDDQQPARWWQHLWNCYRNPINLLLTVLGWFLTPPTT